MAMDVFSLTGKIAVDYSQASSGLSSLKDSAKKTADSLEDVDDAADDAGDSVEDAGDSAEDADDQFSTWRVTLANLASQAITALISKCTELAEQIVDLGIDTETAFAKLETIAGAENIDDLKDSISELSKETGVSSAELANVAYNAISAGSSAEDAMDMVTAATKLGVAGFTDADSALSVLSTAMNSYGDSCGTVEEISDSLIQVQNLGVTTIGDLSTSMGKAIATGSAYSVNLGNLESAYVSITKAGISTEEATTYLNSMLNELGDSGSDVSAILQEQTGKSFTELMEDGNSLADVLGILYDSCDGDSTALMNLWSSAEAGKASNAIVNQGLEEFNENLETITNSSGATEEAYGTMADTMGTQIDVMKTGFEELGLKIYDGLEEPLSNAISFVTDTVIPALEVLIDNFDKIAPVIAAVAAGLITFAIALNFSSICQSVTGVLGGLKTAIQEVNQAISANSLILIVSLIATVVVALITLWNTNEDFRNAVINIWNSIKEVFSTVLETIKTIVTTVFNAIKTTVSTVMNAIKTVITTVWNAIKTAVTTVINAIKTVITTVFNAIKTVITTYVNAYRTVITTVFNAIKTVITTVINAIKTVITTVFNAIKTTITTVVNAIKTTITTVFNAIKTTVSTIWNAIKTAVTTPINAARTAVSTAINAIRTTVSSVFNAVKSTVSTIWNGIKTAITTPITAAKNTVKNIIDTIKGFFNFTFKWPSIPMPHFSISPSGWKVGDLLKGTIPKLGIDWYAKAMEEGMIMETPTVFGVNGDQLMAGGEAGSETVVGTDSLMSMIKDAVSDSSSTNNEQIVELLQILTSWVGSMTFRDQMIDILTKYVVFEYNDRELGRLVRKYV